MQTPDREGRLQRAKTHYPPARSHGSLNHHPRPKDLAKRLAKLIQKARRK